MSEQRRANAELAKKSANSGVWRNVEETVKSGELDNLCENNGNRNERDRDTENCTKKINNVQKMCLSIAGVEDCNVSDANMRGGEREGEGEGDNSTIDCNSNTDSGSGSDSDISDKPHTNTHTNTQTDTHTIAVSASQKGKEGAAVLPDNANKSTSADNRILETQTQSLTPGSSSSSNSGSSSSSSSEKASALPVKLVAHL